MYWACTFLSGKSRLRTQSLYLAFSHEFGLDHLPPFVFFSAFVYFLFIFPPIPPCTFDAELERLPRAASVSGVADSPALEPFSRHPFPLVKNSQCNPASGQFLPGRLSNFLFCPGLSTFRPSCSDSWFLLFELAAGPRLDLAPPPDRAASLIEKRCSLDRCLSTYGSVVQQTRPSHFFPSEHSLLLSILLSLQAGVESLRIESLTVLVRVPLIASCYLYA